MPPSVTTKQDAVTQPSRCVVDIKMGAEFEDGCSLNNLAEVVLCLYHNSLAAEKGLTVEKL